jgi:hypothetical protein
MFTSIVRGVWELGEIIYFDDDAAADCSTDLTGGVVPTPVREVFASVIGAIESL